MVGAISSSSPDRDDDSIQLRQGLHDLKADGSLTRDDVLVIEGMNHGEALFFQFPGVSMASSKESPRRITLPP